MGFFKDEKAHGKAAMAAREGMGEGGPARDEKRRGSLYETSTVKSTSLRNLRDAVDTLRKGR